MLRKKLEIVRKLARKGIRNSETSGHALLRQKLEIVLKLAGKVSEILKPLDTLLPRKHEIVQKLAKEGIRNSDTSGHALLRQKLEIVRKVAGKVSEILKPLDTLSRKKLEIVRKLAGEGIRNSETSGHADTSKT